MSIVGQVAAVGSMWYHSLLQTAFAQGNIRSHSHFCRPICRSCMTACISNTVKSPSLLHAYQLEYTAWLGSDGSPLG